MVNRISELDFMRRVVAVICLNYMHSLMLKITNQSLGFVSAIEWFVFGLVFRLVYFDRYKKNGLKSCAVSVYRRTWAVYKYYFFVVLVLVSLGFMFKSELSLASWPWPPLIEDNYFSSLLGYVLLYDLFPNLQILPIYLVLLAFIPGVILICKVAGVFYIFLISLLIWFFDQLGFLKFRMESCNFFSWQVLFIFGFLSVWLKCLIMICILVQIFYDIPFFIIRYFFIISISRRQ